MEVVVSAVLPMVLEKLVSGMKQGHGRMFGVDEEQRKLESILSVIQAGLLDAEEKQLKDKQIADWLAKLKDAVLDADDILDEFGYEVMLQTLEKPDRPQKRKLWQIITPSPWKHLFSNKSMAVKMKQIVARFDSIADEKSKFHLAEQSGSKLETWDPRETDSQIIESEVIGRDQDKRKIREWLISGGTGVSFVCIVGIGGIGKTTLAQIVYSDGQVVEHFELRMWIYVSDVFNVPHLLKTITELAGKTCASSNMQVLRDAVGKILGGKKFLLVLDDVWNEDKLRWDDLVRSLREGAQGSCVIVTTRSEKISTIAEPQHVHRPQRLSNDDCWKLFEQCALSKCSESRDSNLTAIGREIVERCRGLPLAAKTLGSLLFGASEAMWMSVRQSEIWELEGDKILPSLRLSYKHLPQHVKPCFAYCAVFPKDYEMDRESLVQMWMANGFISPDPNMEMEQKGHEIFSTLISRSLLQDFREHEYGKVTCRMHDLVHDLAQSMVGNGCCVLDKPGNVSHKELRHLSITIDAQLSTTAEVPAPETLRTLLFVNDKHWGQRVFVPRTAQLGTNLRVLDLQSTKIRSFPMSICQMKHLRYLDLSYTDVETIPEAICDLNLQTLRLTSCGKLGRLPDGMGKMRSLRHLYVDECDSLHCMPRGMGQLTCLRTLTEYKVGKEDGSGSIEDLKDLDLCGKLSLFGLLHVKNVAEAQAAGLCSKQNLRSLALFWADSTGIFWEDSSPGELAVLSGAARNVLEALRPPCRLERFGIISYPGSRFPERLMGDPTLYKNLVHIVLRDCRDCEDLPQLGRLPSLEILEMYCLRSVRRMGGDDFYGGGPVFPSLRKLVLFRMGSLEEWSGAERRPAFPRLFELAVMKCPRLQTMPCLPSVQELDIEECPALLPSEGFFRSMGSLKKLKMRSAAEMTRLPELPESLTNLIIEQVSNITSLPEGLGNLTALTDLTLQKLPGLSSLPDGMQRLVALEELKIWDCPSLVSLPIGLQQRLPTLKWLSVAGCPNLQRRFGEGGDYCDLISRIPCKEIGLLGDCSS